MGLLAVVKAGIYSLVVWTGIVSVLLNLVKMIFDKVNANKDGPPGKPNFVVEDAKGAKLQLCKVGGKLYPPLGVKRIMGVRDLHIRADDILLCGYPKTGCHWVYEILFMLRKRKAQLSKHGKTIGGMLEAMPPIVIDSLPSPRVLNSHLPLEDLPTALRYRKTKIVVTTRNPKDIVVSFYNHHMGLKKFFGYNGEFCDFFRLFMSGNITQGDFFDYWLKWEIAIKTQKDTPILVVPYEELKETPLSKVLEIASFLGTPISETFAQEILDACAFHTMQEKRGKTMGRHLFRTGRVGDWRSWLTEEMSSAIDKRWEEKMKDCVYQPRM